MNLAKRILVIILFLIVSVATIHAQDHQHDDTEDTTGLSNVATIAISLGVAALTTGIVWVVARQRFTLLDYGIHALIVTTALIHIVYAGLSYLLLLLNGLGYLGLAGLYLLPITAKPPYRRILNGITIIYTLITIIGYFATHLDHFDKLGLVTKAVEILLVGLIALDIFRKPAMVTTE